MILKFDAIHAKGKWSKEMLPLNPSILIVINEYSTDMGSISASLPLNTESEIDYAINELQKSLEAIRKKAKRMLNSENEKIRSSFINKVYE